MLGIAVLAQALSLFAATQEPQGLKEKQLSFGDKASLVLRLSGSKHWGDASNVVGLGSF